MSPEEHEAIMDKVIDLYGELMPDGSHTVMLSIRPDNACTVISTMPDHQTMCALQQAVAVKRMIN